MALFVKLLRMIAAAMMVVMALLSLISLWDGDMGYVISFAALALWNWFNFHFMGKFSKADQ